MTYDDAHKDRIIADAAAVIWELGEATTGCGVDGVAVRKLQALRESLKPPSELPSDEELMGIFALHNTPYEGIRSLYAHALELAAERCRTQRDSYGHGTSYHRAHNEMAVNLDGLAAEMRARK